MISSESINFSKYSKIIGDNKESNQNKILIDTKEISDDKQESEELSQSLTLSNSDMKKSEEHSKGIISNSIYGNPYEFRNPKVIGKSYALFYDNKGNPRVTIGPDCKYFEIFIYNYYYIILILFS